LAGKKGLSRRQLAIVLFAAAAGILLMLFGGIPQGNRDHESAAESDWQTYLTSLEQKACLLCGEVAGISEVTVAISLEQGVEYVYADESERYGSRQAVLLTERPPQISGIGVVCRGADDPAAVERLVSLLSAAFGVGSHRIYITQAG